MKRYDKYKDSGIAWIGNIPEHWEVQKIKQVASCNDEALTENTPPDTSLKYVEISDVNASEGITNLTEYEFSKAPSRARRVTKVDDIIISTVRTYLKAIARVNEPELIVSTGFAVLRAKNINALYLSYTAQSSRFLDTVVANSTGVNYPAITANKLISLSLPLPPLREQEAIVAYLEEKTSEMDTLVEKKEELIVRLRELKQSTIAKAVTQGLDATAPLVPSGIPWLGDVPQLWEVKRLGALFTENKTSNTGLLHTNAYKFNYGTLVRKYEDVSLPEVLEIYSKYTVLREKDIVINGLNLNYDFISQRIALALEPSIITSAYLVLSPKAFISQLYYCFLFKAMDSKKLFHGMGTGIRLTLSYRELKSQSLPCPPLAEQEAIVAYIEQKTCEIDRLIECTEQEIARIRELKQSLIADAVTGRFKVPTLNN